MTDICDIVSFLNIEKGSDFDIEDLYKRVLQKGYELSEDYVMYGLLKDKFFPSLIFNDDYITDVSSLPPSLCDKERMKNVLTIGDLNKFLNLDSNFSARFDKYQSLLRSKKKELDLSIYCYKNIIQSQIFSSLGEKKNEIEKETLERIKEKNNLNYNERDYPSSEKLDALDAYKFLKVKKDTHPFVVYHELRKKEIDLKEELTKIYALELNLSNNQDRDEDDDEEDDDDDLFNTDDNDTLPPEFNIFDEENKEDMSERDITRKCLVELIEDN